MAGRERPAVLTDAPLDPLDLADYRRRVADLYCGVRARGGGATAHQWWRGQRDELFRSHGQSPVPLAERDAFDGVPGWAYDPAFATVGHVVPTSSPRAERLGHSGAGETSFVHVGTVQFHLAGRPHELALWWLDSYGGGLFLPFRDATCGTETYGGGRYLLDGAKSADLGRKGGEDLILDFNFAYHPSCVHDSRWSCPLAPPENHLDVAVRAGERLT